MYGGTLGWTWQQRFYRVCVRVSGERGHLRTEANVCANIVVRQVAPLGSASYGISSSISFILAPLSRALAASPWKVEGTRSEFFFFRLASDRLGNPN
mmetsp:Transcript_11437/g.31906  ORF Transcript_11437/g.31906 Transcript_11437/m.31906 type:complete len:97 (+) Transcript_11437:1328-1618(+)